jgi:hypothetical protein
MAVRLSMRNAPSTIHRDNTILRDLPSGPNTCPGPAYQWRSLSRASCRPPGVLVKATVLVGWA